MELPKKGFYRHFKGNRYELIDFAKHSETQETMVVYRARYGEYGLWVRPLSMWAERVERDGQIYTRFLPEEEYLRLHGAADEYVPPPEEAPPELLDEFIPPEDWEEPAAELPVSANGDKLDVLRSVYGYDSFREGQAEVIDAILAGRDALAILPTGAGKSVCYQIPAQMLRGVALVVSPLISLMKDQVEALTQAGVPAAYLNSSLTDRQFDAVMNRLARGKYRIVYVAPERLLTPRFLNVVRQLSISMVAVDEAHCISQWGQDFRPSYLEIPDFIEQLSVRPRVCAFTATATERVRQDVVRLLRMRDPFVRVTGFDRKNLYFSVSYPKDKDAKLRELIEAYRGFSGIVYCATRKGVEALCEKLQRAGYPATRYHAGLSEVERHRNQEDFIYDRAPVMVATNAFGMGIDKSNVRFVIHYNMPKDLESYYQEAGRAGRDGERADCHLLFESKDVVLQNFFIDKMGEEAGLKPEVLKQVQERARVRLRAMTSYGRTTQCLRKTILRYFGEAHDGNCGYCANCLCPQELTDVTEYAKLLVACVKESRWTYGVQFYSDVLRGSKSKRVVSSRLANTLYYGALKDLSNRDMQFIVDALVEDEVLGITTDEFPTLCLSKNAESLLNGERKVYARRAEEEKSAKTSQTSTSSKRRATAKVLPGDVDQALFELLRSVRTQLARERHVAPYLICSDATLSDMCRLRPTDAATMLQVRGMGDRKIQSFGARFAQAILDYTAKNE